MSPSGLPSPTILRFWFPLKDDQVGVYMPRGSKVLHIAAGYLGVNTANPIIELWALADPDETKVPHRFRVVGTGHLADVVAAHHLGTVMHDLPGGRGVWHVFDVGEDPA